MKKFLVTAAMLCLMQTIDYATGKERLAAPYKTAMNS